MNVVTLVSSLCWPLKVVVLSFDFLLGQNAGQSLSTAASLASAEECISLASSHVMA